MVDFHPTIDMASDKISAQDAEKHYNGVERTALTALSYGGVVLPGIPMFHSMTEKRKWQLEHMVS